MRFVFLSYNYSGDIRSPEAWINRIRFYVGSLECLAKTNTVIRIDQVNYAGEFFHNGVQYHFVNNKDRKKFFPSRLHILARDQNPDVVIVAGLHYPLQVIQLRFKLGRRVKIFLQNHAEKPFTGIKKYLQRFADRYVDGYFFASHEAGAAWVQKNNISALKKIHEVMEVSSAFSQDDKNAAKLRTGVNGNPVFLWVGRLNQNKDPLTVINAFLKFAEHEPAARLYMIYQATDLLAEIKKNIGSDVHKAIILVGEVPHDKMQDWYNSADFFVSGSYYEGSGTALCEAMSCGCIPIVTDIPAFRAITDKGKCGLLYQPGNEEALLSTLIQTKRMDIQQTKSSVLEQFNKKLSFEAIAKRIQEITASA